MLLTSVGAEPATSWSPVGWCIQMSHQGRTDRGMDGWKVITIAHPEHSSGELKISLLSGMDKLSRGNSIKIVFASLWVDPFHEICLPCKNMAWNLTSDSCPLSLLVKVKSVTFTFPVLTSSLRAFSSTSVLFSSPPQLNNLLAAGLPSFKTSLRLVYLCIALFGVLLPPLFCFWVWLSDSAKPCLVESTASVFFLESVSIFPPFPIEVSLSQFSITITSSLSILTSASASSTLSELPPRRGSSTKPWISSNNWSSSLLSWKFWDNKEF